MRTIGIFEYNSVRVIYCKNYVINAALDKERLIVAFTRHSVSTGKYFYVSDFYNQ